MKSVAQGILGALVVSSALVAHQGCSSTDKKGGVVVAVATDLTAPKDVDQVGLFIAAEGKPLFAETRPVAPDGTVRFPATLAVAGDVDRPLSLTVRVVAFSQGQPKILRDVLTTIPTTRVVTLRVPLHFLSTGSAVLTNLSPTGSASSGVRLRAVDANFDLFLGVQSSCPAKNGKIQTSVAGVCKDADVDSALLPDFDAKVIFGGGESPTELAPVVAGHCHDVAKCFSGAQIVAPNLGDCTATVAVPTGTAGNYALRTTDGTGSCTGDGCLVPLDHYPAEDVANRDAGFWSEVDQGRGGTLVHLPPAVCASLARPAGDPSKRFDAVVVGTGCDAWKNQEVPLCGPASATDGSLPPPASAAEGKNPNGSALLDGGAVVPGDAGAGQDAGAPKVVTQTFPATTMTLPGDLAFAADTLFVGAERGSLYTYSANGVETELRPKSQCLAESGNGTHRRNLRAFSEDGITAYLGDSLTLGACGYYASAKYSVATGLVAGTTIAKGGEIVFSAVISPEVNVTGPELAAYFQAGSTLLPIQLKSGVAPGGVGAIVDPYRAMVVDADPRYIDAAQETSVVRFDRIGHGQTTIFDLNTSGLFMILTSLARDAGAFYAIAEDSDNGPTIYVLRYDLATNAITKAPIASVLRGNVVHPRGIAIDDTNVYFARDNGVGYLPKNFAEGAAVEPLHQTSPTGSVTSVITYTQGGTKKIAYLDTSMNAVHVSHFE